MDKDFLVQLAKKVYHLTILFPKKEPLRYRIRELAIDILQKPDEQDLETLNSFFELAKDQNWVKQEDILAIQTDYANLVQVFAKQKTIEFPKSEAASEGGATSLEANLAHSGRESCSEAGQEKKTEAKFQPLTAKTLMERQEKIMAILKEKGRAQVWEMKQIFPQVSKRTLRRDFEFLFKQGVIDRIGEKNNTYYQVKIG